MPKPDEEEWSDAVNDKAKETPQVTLQRKFIQQQKKRNQFNADSDKMGSTIKSVYPTTRTSNQINSAQDPGKANELRYLRQGK